MSFFDYKSTSELLSKMFEFLKKNSKMDKNKKAELQSTLRSFLNKDLRMLDPSYEKQYEDRMLSVTPSIEDEPPKG